ncbi:MAG: helix-turn-helix domain-containing protein [Oscillospiraceae bacterium]
MTIGRNIRTTRERKDLEQKELAERSGLSSALICMYEKGVRTPTIGNLIKIATALDVTAEELMKGVS